MRKLICRICKEEKEKNELRTNRAFKNNVENICKQCSKEQKRVHYLNNKERYAKRFKEYARKNKKQIAEYRKNYLSSKHGKIMQIMQNIRKRCDDPTNKRYHRYGGRGIKNNISYDEISMIWDRDDASKMKKPSLDRIDVNVHYDKNNCQFIEMVENSRKDLVRAVNQIDNDGNVVKTWRSISDAERSGFQIANIIKCCKGQRRHHGGFAWSYK